ncbi:uncharacterized protein LOC118755444, partial [Rhagoletis pomonella]|uniref:uncharacterized protein LOC118755444 n=1 Tax=Rhagoletis pomonella TaxID=28610 RepID=UPI001781C29C
MMPQSSRLPNLKLPNFDGDALHTVKAFQVNEENYAKALNRLAESTCDVVILATALVKINDRFGNSHHVRALLDSGSQVNFISDECANKLKLNRRSKDLSVLGIGEVNSSVRHVVNATVQSRLNDYSFQADFWVLKSISSSQPEINLPVESWQVPDNIELADPHFNKSQKIDLLIGADIFFELLSVGQIKLDSTLPTLQKTLFGWIVSGRYINVENGQSAVCNLINRSNMEMTSIESFLRKFWEIEEIPSQSRNFAQEQNDCEKHFVANTKLLEIGRFEVPLPFKVPASSLGSSHEIAKRRFLALERRLVRTPKIQE